MWCAYDVTVCVFHNHDVGVIYIERDSESHAEVYRYDYFIFLTRHWFSASATLYASRFCCSFLWFNWMNKFFEIVVDLSPQAFCIAWCFPWLVRFSCLELSYPLDSWGFSLTLERGGIILGMSKHYTRVLYFILQIRYNWCPLVILLQCSFNTMLGIGSQHFSWSLSMWLNHLSLYR